MLFTYALRLIPVLEPSHAEQFLLNKRREAKAIEDQLIVSFAIPSGKMYSENVKRALDPLIGVEREDFSLGTTFRSDLNLPSNPGLKYVLNTYYTSDGFEKLARKCGFQIAQSIQVSDQTNDRVVVLLQPIGLG